MAYIEGYLDEISVAPGERFHLHAAGDGETSRLRIVREGARPTLMLTERIEVSDLEPLPDAWERGAGWPVCREFVVPRDWPSGVYRIELHTLGERGRARYVHWGERRAQHDIMLVVRASQPGVQNRILLQLATNTYAAYNPWGGRSLYPYNSTDRERSHRVSFLRPGHGYYGDSLSHADFPQWERRFLVWAERNGFGVDLAINYDLERWPPGFDDYSLILSVGHDEYWSSPMRDNLEAFVSGGGNAAFLSGNSVCWQVRFEDEGRTIVCFKDDYRRDPLYATGDHRRLSTLWSHPLVGRPENQTTGVGFRYGGYHRFFGQFSESRGDYRAQNTDHWVFAGTGLTDGESFGGSDRPPRSSFNAIIAERAHFGTTEYPTRAAPILGYECDGCDIREVDGRLVPTGIDGTPTDFAVLAYAPARWAGREQADAVFQEAGVAASGHAVMGIHTNGGTVFTAGTTDWVYALGRDVAVDRITGNVLRRLGGTR